MSGYGCLLIGVYTSSLLLLVGGMLLVFSFCGGILLVFSFCGGMLLVFSFCGGILIGVSQIMDVR